MNGAVISWTILVQVLGVHDDQRVGFIFKDNLKVD